MKTKGSFTGFHTTPDELLSVLKNINREFEEHPESIPDLRDTTLTEIICKGMKEKQDDPATSRK